jgi:hypothetical protein
MDRLFSIALLWLIFFHVPHDVLGQEAYLTLKYSDEQAEELRYFTTPLEDGTYSLSKRFRVAPDPDGYLRLKIRLAKPGYVYTSGSNGPLTIYIEPGKNVIVNIGNDVVFSGDLRRENNLLKRFQSPNRSKTDVTVLQYVLQQAPSVATFRDSLEAAMRSDKKTWEAVVAKDKKLSAGFRNFVVLNTLYFALLQAEKVIVSKLRPDNDRSYDSVAAHDWRMARKQLFPDTLINSGLVTSANYSQFLYSYFNSLWNNSTHDFGEERSDSLAIAQTSYLTDKYFRGTAKATLMSWVISMRLLQAVPRHNASLMGYYEKYKNEFPASLAIMVLEPGMKRIAGH